MESFLRFMETSLDANASQHLPAPGLHRLNRTEYANAIRDLLSLEVDATKFLPPDDSTRGFDNIAGALTMSPALMEAYLSAAGKISRLAIGDVSAPTQAVFDVPADTAQNYHIEGLPFGTRGGMLIKHSSRPTATTIHSTSRASPATSRRSSVRVTGEQLEVTVDGERVKLFDWDKEIKSTTGNGKSTPRDSGHGRPAHRRRDIPRDQRPARHRTEPAVPADDEHARRDSRLPVLSARRSGDDRRAVQREGRDRHGQPPQDLRLRADRRRVRNKRARARSSSTLAKHAFRRPVDRRGVNGLMEFYKARPRAKVAASTTASSRRCSASSPIPSSSIAASRSRPISLPARAIAISDLALASRLSFFLWSSIPDDELIDIAAQGQLKDPAVLEQQVRRMLRGSEVAGARRQLHRAVAERARAAGPPSRS